MRKLSALIVIYSMFSVQLFAANPTDNYSSLNISGALDQVEAYIDTADQMPADQMMLMLSDLDKQLETFKVAQAKHFTKSQKDRLHRIQGGIQKSLNIETKLQQCNVDRTDYSKDIISLAATSASLIPDDDLSCAKDFVRSVNSYPGLDAISELDDGLAEEALAKEVLLDNLASSVRAFIRDRYYLKGSEVPMDRDSVKKDFCKKTGSNKAYGNSPTRCEEVPELNNLFDYIYASEAKGFRGRRFGSERAEKIKKFIDKKVDSLNIQLNSMITKGERKTGFVEAAWSNTFGNKTFIYACDPKTGDLSGEAKKAYENYITLYNEMISGGDTDTVDSRLNAHFVLSQLSTIKPPVNISEKECVNGKMEIDFDLEKHEKLSLGDINKAVKNRSKEIDGFVDDEISDSKSAKSYLTLRSQSNPESFGRVLAKNEHLIDNVCSYIQGFHAGEQKKETLTNALNIMALATGAGGIAGIGIRAAMFGAKGAGFLARKAGAKTLIGRTGYDDMLSGISKSMSAGSRRSSRVLLEGKGFNALYLAGATVDATGLGVLYKQRADQQQHFERVMSNTPDSPAKEEFFRQIELTDQARFDALLGTAFVPLDVLGYRDAMKLAKYMREDELVKLTGDLKKAQSQYRSIERSPNQLRDFNELNNSLPPTLYRDLVRGIDDLQTTSSNKVVDILADYKMNRSKGEHPADAIREATHNTELAGVIPSNERIRELHLSSIAKGADRRLVSNAQASYDDLIKKYDIRDPDDLITFSKIVELKETDGFWNRFINNRRSPAAVKKEVDELLTNSCGKKG